MAVQHAVLAGLAYVPMLLNARGRVAADTKTYLYLDPERLLSRAPWMWDASTGFGTVSHQTIGYLFPMGPWFWLFDRLGAPDWVAHRLWLATILFAAGAGFLFLLRTLRDSSWTPAMSTAATAAALVYMLTPYTLQYASRLSALLLPWAGLPWMVALAQRALRTGGWRHPAAFALVVTTIGSVNATALLLAGLGPLLWVAFATWVHREVSPRQAAATVARIGVLTSACSLWWVAGLMIQGGYGVDVLRYSETLSTVASTSIASEVLRGLGYWFFYGGDKLGPWTEQGPRYMSVVWLLAASFAVPALGIAAAALARWRYRAFAVTLVVLGTATSVGAYPYGSPMPAGALFKRFAESSSAGLAMRSTPRAVPLGVLGLALATIAALAGLARRRPRAATVTSALVAVVAVVAMQPLFGGAFLSENLLRDEDVPRYWQEAAAHLDAQPHDTRVLELPGIDFAAYRWGQTVDPITPGMIDRPYAARELIPQGSAATADLLNALDRRLQEGLFQPAAVAPVARLMGVGDVVLRSDLQYERFRTARPRQTWALFFPSPPGLGDPVGFGDPVENAPDPRFPLRDEFELTTPPGAPHPPPVAAFPVRDPSPIVWAAPAGRPVLLAGDGEGLVHAAAMGLLDGKSPVLYSAALADRPGLRRDAIDAGARLIVTDSNRRRARHWRGLLETFGSTEVRGSSPLRRDPADNRLPVFPAAGEDSYTAARHDGVREVRATSYGNPVTYTPENRPVNAFDGDLRTAWRAGDFTVARGERIEIELDEAIEAGEVTLVQPLTGATNRFITEVELRLDGDVVDTFTLDASSRTSSGQTLRFAERRFRTISLEVAGDNVGDADTYRGISPVGFAEIRIPGVSVHEVIDLPRDLLAPAGERSRANELTLLLERVRLNPLLTGRQDEELAMARGFALPTQRSFRLFGEARLSAAAPGALIDELMSLGSNRTGGITVGTSSVLNGDLTSRGSAAVDGDSSTAWRTAFREHNIVGATIDVELGTERSVDRLDLVVVADGEHSVPTRLRLEAGGESRTVAMPEIARQTERGATAEVPLRFAALRGSNLRVVIEAVRPATSLDYYDEAPVMRPVGIAELGIPGVLLPAGEAEFDSGCRADLLQIDGEPVPVRITGTRVEAERREPLSVELCGASALSLAEGEHVLRSTAGDVSGIDIDSLVLQSDPDNDAAVAADAEGALVEVLDEGRVSYDLRVTHGTEPFWLVLKQSHSPGWEASAKGLGDLGPPVLINGFANGWLIDPETAGELRVELDWTPQRVVWAGLAASAVAVLLCLAIALAPVIRRGTGNAPRPATTGAPAPQLGLPAFASSPAARRPARIAVAAGVCAGFSALLAGPPIGMAIGATVAISLAVGRWGRVLLAGGAVAAFALAAAIVVAKVWYRGGPPPDFTWPSYFETPHLLALVAVLLLASDALAGWISRARRPDRAPRRPEP